MKKTFPLKVPGKDDARVVAAIKNDVRKYVKRERRKALPEGFDLWQVDCKVGVDQAAAETKALAEVNRAIDEIAATGAAHVYVEILATPSHRARPSKESICEGGG